ncbi:MAG: hypothetical protein WDZ80_01815 [Candidatus Paceibacterota bacterium]
MANNKDKDLKQRVLEEEDFIYCPRLRNSVSKMIEKNPEGIDNERIAKVMLMEEEEVETVFQSAILKLRKILKV